MLSWRIASAAAGIPLLLGATYLGGWPLAALVSLLNVVSAEETARLLAPGEVARAWSRAWAAAAPWVALLAGREWLLPAWCGASLLFLAHRGVLAARARRPEDLHDLGRQPAATLFALFYPAVLLTHLVLLRHPGPVPGPAAGAPHAPAWAVLFLVWANDTASYFAGRALGGPRLAPLVSPGKTVAGGLAGLAAAAAVGAGAGPGLLGLPVPAAAVFALLVGLAAQAGDLFESLLKRSAGVKDSGRLIPGHGGVLDRFDSLAFALPLSYYLLMYVAAA